MVKGEWNASTLQCVTDTSSARCGDNLGNTYGTPTIRRMHDGHWAAIFGNGYNSRNGKAGVYIMTVNDDGVSFRFLATGVGSTTTRNGIAYVTPVDLDGDNVVDYLYAGDLQGNVWRFDVTSADPAQWRVRAEPVFQTGGLPITTQVAVAQVATLGEEERLMLNFGTGRILPQTLSSAAVPDSRSHFLFGVWDWDMSGWNRRSSKKLLSRGESDQHVPSGKMLKPINLTLQTITTNSRHSTATISGVRTMTRLSVCWAGSSTCASPRVNDQFGWRVQLPGTREQVVFNPVVQDGLFQVSSIIPARAQTLACEAAAPASGFTMAITPDQGIAPATSYFFDALNRDRTMVQVIGVGLSAVGTPSHVTANGKRYMLTQTANGTPALTRVTLPAVGPPKRLTWLKLR